MKLTTCLICGYKELWIKLDKRTEGILHRSQIVIITNHGKGFCYRCKGYIKIDSPKWKLTQKIMKRFPEKVVIRTFMNIQDVADGKGEMIDDMVIDDNTKYHLEKTKEIVKLTDWLQENYQR